MRQLDWLKDSCLLVIEFVFLPFAGEVFTTFVMNKMMWLHALDSFASCQVARLAAALQAML